MSKCICKRRIDSWKSDDGYYTLGKVYDYYININDSISISDDIGGQNIFTKGEFEYYFLDVADERNKKINIVLQ